MMIKRKRDATLRCAFWWMAFECRVWVGHVRVKVRQQKRGDYKLKDDFHNRMVMDLERRQMCVLGKFIFSDA